jgi:hypothetical protein
MTTEALESATEVSVLVLVSLDSSPRASAFALAASIETAVALLDFMADAKDTLLRFVVAHLCQAGRKTLNEHLRFSSTTSTAPALSNSPQ